VRGIEGGLPVRHGLDLPSRGQQMVHTVAHLGVVGGEEHASTLAPRCKRAGRAIVDYGVGKGGVFRLPWQPAQRTFDEDPGVDPCRARCQILHWRRFSSFRDFPLIKRAKRNDYPRPICGA
jgi:hypothetical protein